MTPDGIRHGCLVLATHTGWGLRELLDLELEEFTAWLEALRDLKR